ncbi:MAG: alpha/beta hydrolase [Chloroflexi bacterium]|nr:alpha/beta hydrolase [Chloroflexota bacterium]
MTADFFKGFAVERVDVGEAVLRVRHGGHGSPVVLLHGHPRTHATWHKVAPRLADRHRVVCPDLRGYGESSKPPTTDDHAPYSKRAMARDIIRLMSHLGHERFAVVGHDRGSYVAFRLALDAPSAVTHLALLDSVPIGDALARCNERFARRWWHWFFLGQTTRPAERLINVDPETWYMAQTQRVQMGEDAFADFLRAIRDPQTVHAMCEDYRAGLSIDGPLDQADRLAGRQLACPLLVLWAARDDLPYLYGDVLDVWRAWAPHARGGAIDSGHHMSEEAPDALAGALLRFLADP